MGKNLTLILVGVVVLALIGGGIYMFTNVASGGGVDQTDSTSDDGMVSLGATFYTEDAQEAGGGVPQALVGGTSRRTHVIFELKATNTGDVELTDIIPSSPNANMNGAFDNVGALPTLIVGAVNILVGSSGQDCPGGDGDCDTNEECIVSAGNKCAIRLDDYASGTSAHNVDFTISLSGNFLNAIGEAQGTSSNPVTLTYDIRDETCTDGTTINTCVFARTGLEEDKPLYCSWTEGTAPVIEDKASICGCPPGEGASGDACVPLTCSDGTLTGECSTTSTEGTYGAYMFCDGTQTLVPDCGQCGCTDDAHGNPSTGCSGSSCTFQSYTGGLSGGIGEG